MIVWLCSALCLQGQTLSKGFSAEPIPDSIWHFMQGRSYRPNDYIQRADLRYLRVLHYDYDGRTHQGELVCNKLIASKLLTIFRELYEARYPIERISLADNYDGDDERQMRANNTSCFNFRIVSDTKHLSKHAPLPKPFTNIHVSSACEMKCKMCARVCPMQLTPYDSRGQEIGFLDPDCLKCGKCTQACPTKIITLKHTCN